MKISIKQALKLRRTNLNKKSRRYECEDKRLKKLNALLDTFCNPDHQYNFHDHFEKLEFIIEEFSLEANESKIEEAKKYIDFQYFDHYGSCGWTLIDETIDA